ncbi:MAG: hypothetical protein HZA62_02460 [Rhodocyclales bacterium]|nr:hypothetical protein [Rhodocyclales bacterium]
MLGIVSSAVLREKAVQLVAGFSRDIAAPAKASRKTASPESVADGALQSLFRSVAEFCSEQRLSVIGRARLARTLQDELQRQGFPGDMVSKVTGAVTINALAAPERKNRAGG